MKTKPIISTVICTFLFVMFTYVAFSQLIEMKRLSYWIDRAHILRSQSSKLAYGLVAIELLVGVLLIVPNKKLPGLLATFALLFAYNAYVVAVMLNSINLPKTFDGIYRGIGWYQQISVNIGLIGLAYWAVWHELGQCEKSPAINRDKPPVKFRM